MHLSRYTLHRSIVEPGAYTYICARKNETRTSLSKENCKNTYLDEYLLYQVCLLWTLIYIVQFCPRWKYYKCIVQFSVFSIVSILYRFVWNLYINSLHRTARIQTLTNICYIRERRIYQPDSNRRDHRGEHFINRAPNILCQNGAKIFEGAFRVILALWHIKMNMF